jgi:hypothetical protein
MQSRQWLLAFVITMMLIDSWAGKSEANPARSAPTAAADPSPNISHVEMPMTSE